MAITDGERQEILGRIKQAEAKLTACKSKANADLYEVVRHLVNCVKQLSGDQTPLVE